MDAPGAAPLAVLAPVADPAAVADDDDMINPPYGGVPVDNFVPAWALAVSGDVHVIGRSHTLLDERQRHAHVVWRRATRGVAVPVQYHRACWLQRVDSRALAAAGVAAAYDDHLVQATAYDARQQWADERLLSLCVDLTVDKHPPLDSLVGVLKDHFMAGTRSERAHMFDYLCDGLAGVYQCAVLTNVRVCTRAQFVFWRHLLDFACDNFGWDKLAVTLQPHDWPLAVTRLNFAAHGHGPDTNHKGLKTYKCMRAACELPANGNLRGHHADEYAARNESDRHSRAQLFLTRSWGNFQAVDNLGQILPCPSYVHGYELDAMLAIMSRSKGPEFARYMDITKQLAERLQPALDDEYLVSVRGGYTIHGNQQNLDWVASDPRFMNGHHPHQLGLPDPFSACPATIFDFQRLGDQILQMLLKDRTKRSTILGLLRRACVFVNRDSPAGGACFLLKVRDKDGNVTFAEHLRAHFETDFDVWDSLWGKKNDLLKEFMRTSSVKAYARMPFALRDRANQHCVEPKSCTYNTFTGCAAWSYNLAADWKRSPEFLAFAQHVIFDLCAGERRFAYIVFHWLAAIVFECKRTNRYLMFCGPQGHGKTKFFTFVTTYLVGKVNTITHTTTDTLFGPFQPPEMATSLLIVGEDSDGVSQPENAKMRTIVASPDTAFNCKHKHAVQQTNNCCNVMFGVNKVEEKTFFISNDERRAVVIECSGTYPTLSPGQQFDYMTEYHEALETNPRVTAEHTSAYLSTLDARAFLRDACMLRTDSPLSDQMRIKSMKPVERYLVNVCCGHVTLKDEPYVEARTMTMYDFEQSLVKQVGQQHVRMQDVRGFLERDMDVTFGLYGGADAVFFPHVKTARAALRRSHYKNGGFEASDYKVKPWACLKGAAIKYDHESAPTYEQLIAILGELATCKIIDGEVVHDQDPDRRGVGPVAA